MLESLFSEQIRQPFLREIPALESLFSHQVSQQYVLNEDFPLYKKVLDERIFRHITFLEDDPNLKVRLRTVDHNGRSPNETSIILQKTINIEIDESDAELFRIKTVLSEEDHGVSESYWVSEKRVAPDSAASFNQYRLRGVSVEGIKSDWVYSSIKDDKNDTIIYNMLYDVLEVMLNAYDDQLEMLMDHVITDTFLELIKTTSPNLYKSLESDERYQLKMDEVVSAYSHELQNKSEEKLFNQLVEKFVLLGSVLKEELKETVFASSEEFSELYRIYKAVDQYQEKNTDFLTLLIEIFLEDRYEQLEKNVNVEALLQNEEEMGAFLKGSFDFDIKSELIAATCNASLDDRFVSGVNDAVELLSEPIFYDQLVYKKDEELEKFLRLALKDLYAPMLAVEHYIVTLESELYDHHKQSKNDYAAGYSLINTDGHEIRNMIFYDFIEALIKGDMEIKNDFHLTFIDSIIHQKNDLKKSIILNYGFEEILNVFFSIGETFRQSYLSLNNKSYEEVAVNLIEENNLIMANLNSTFKESYTAMFSELNSILSVIKTDVIHENDYVSLIDEIAEQYKAFKKAVDEFLSASLNDHVFSSDIKDNTELTVNKKLHLSDMATKNITFQEDMIKEYEILQQEDHYYNLFKHYLRNPNKFPIKDKRFVQFYHELKDYLLMDWKDDVQYALGDMDNGWTLGVFKLGVNTLKGEA
ncbi:hypothetical protein [Bacillus subtilis]|uniref:Uncharacterized protein n=1 Tax=Bacillus subtilis TaxID=1423 RepID=A0A8I1WFL7_BACIU|nr:hypothetical protein [Bacillus subtilis]KAF2421683.1 hypothetical protein B6K89_21055 [Bacillus subtilis]MBO3794260.1 hypothetical protein [Bacillus subtilis]